MRSSSCLYESRNLFGSVKLYSLSIIAKPGFRDTAHHPYIGTCFHGKPFYSPESRNLFFLRSIKLYEQNICIAAKT